MNKTKILWLSMASLFALVLVWRLVDFFFELAANEFTMSRAGLSLSGLSAGMVEIIIISSVVCALLAASKQFQSALPVHEKRR